MPHMTSANFSAASQNHASRENGGATGQMLYKFGTTAVTVDLNNIEILECITSSG